MTCVLAAFLLIVILQSSTVLWAQDSGSTPTRTLGTPTGGYWTGSVSGALPSKIPADALAKWGGNIGSLPTSFSWSGWDGVSNIGTNYMTSVRNQGGCGSCWAFAAVGDMEAQYQINKAKPSSGIDLSEQNVLECSGGSCSGWYLDGTLNYLKNSGTPDEACNPYTAANYACGTGRCSDYLSRTYKITDWTWISTDTATIKYYLYNHGPVLVWMPIFNDFPWWNATFWQLYYYGHDTSGSYDGHFVVIVGWNDAGTPYGYWIVRNSWGTSGGDVNDYGGGSHGGYFYMTMNPTTGFFGIYQEAAVISDVTAPSQQRAFIPFMQYAGYAVVWRPSTSVWYVRNPDASAWAKQWGTSGDVPLLGDVDHDGAGDLIIWRPSSGVWYILQSSTGYGYGGAVAYQWGSGALNDVPLVGDVDGDGKADLIIWRPSSGVWYVLKSSTGFTSAVAYQWGTNGDVPLVDSSVNLIIWRPSNDEWYILQSSTGYSSAVAYQWGTDGDIV